MTEHLPALSTELSNVTRKVTSILTSKNIPHMVVGGIAAGAHSKPRATVDLDILISSRYTTSVQALFPGASPLDLSGRDGFTVSIDGIDVDFLIANDHEDFLLREKQHHHGGVDVANVFHILYLKLISNRIRDSDDVAQILMKIPQSQIDMFPIWLKANFQGQHNLKDILDDFESLKAIAELEKAHKKAGSQFRTFMIKKLAKKSQQPPP
jgi:hypothetical protein